MACFLAPVGEAIVMTIIQKRVEKKEKLEAASGGSAPGEERRGVPFSMKLGWLNRMLWGGAFLLALEHIWHGEVVPWPPFLTAMNNPADVGPMLKEIATVGVTMAVLVTAVWGVMVWVSDRQERRETLPAENRRVEG